MSRQRRMDAIARRREFLDNQLQLLSSNEARIPNIIRNRTGNTQRRPRYQPFFSGMGEGEGTNSLYVLPVNSLSSFGDTHAGASSYHSIPPPEAVISTVKIDPGSGPVASVEGRPPEEKITIKEEVAEAVPIPITITNADIAKMLAGNEELMKSFQTIQTEDGTVMVVLEGGDFGEERQLIQGENGPSSSEYGGVASNNNGGLSRVEDTTESSLSIEGIEQVPGAEEQTVFVDDNNESYVIVQTPEGPVLLPSSMYAQSQEVETAPGSDEGIMDFVAAEGGAIERLIKKKKSTPIKPPVTRKMKRTYPTSSTCKVGQTRPGSSISASTQSSNNFPGKSKPTISSLHTLMLSHTAGGSPSQTTIDGPAPPELEQEKPRPFRFELPELDNNMNDLSENFMSVPVPITIDSLRSQTDNRKTVEFKTDPQFHTWRATPTSGSFRQSPSTTQGLSGRGPNDMWEFKCITCSEVFSKESDLRLHSQQSHVETTKSVNDSGSENTSASSVITSSVSKSESITTSSHSESHIALAQNLLKLQDNIYAIKTSNKEGEESTVYIQFVDAEGIDIKATLKKAKIDSEGEAGDVTKLGVDECHNHVGRRTLNKASAKANMLSELFPGGDSWECQSETESVIVKGDILNNVGDDGQAISIQSARIRARHDRTKALDHNGANEEEIGDNFQKIFLQVCK